MKCDAKSRRPSFECRCQAGGVAVARHGASVLTAATCTLPPSAGLHTLLLSQQWTHTNVGIRWQHSQRLPSSWRSRRHRRKPLASLAAPHAAFLPFAPPLRSTAPSSNMASAVSPSVLSRGMKPPRPRSASALPHSKRRLWNSALIQSTLLCWWWGRGRGKTAAGLGGGESRADALPAGCKQRTASAAARPAARSTQICRQQREPGRQHTLTPWRQPAWQRP